MTIPRFIAMVLLIVILTTVFFVFRSEIWMLVKLLSILTSIILSALIVSYLIMVIVTGEWIPLDAWSST